MDREMVDLEVARIVRATYQSVEARIRASQMGEAFAASHEPSNYVAGNSEGDH